MTTKTLSNGTLSLRFMQNAQRAKNESQIEARQAKIDDDAEWHVSSEIRDTWEESEPTPASLHSSITHEASYLPFIFPENDGSHADGRPTLKSVFQGRRFFDLGKEIIETEAPVTKPEESLTDIPKLVTNPSSRQGLKPVAISVSKSTKSAKASMSVQSSIRQAVDVGNDIKSLRWEKLDQKSCISSGSGYLKPAGVDAPPERSTTANLTEVSLSEAPSFSGDLQTSSKSKAESIVQMAKLKTTANVNKRSREDNEEPGTSIDPSLSQSAGEDMARKKRKKKRNKVEENE